MWLRTPRGTWLVARASPLGTTQQVAIVLEPARAADIAPIMIDAYRLTTREITVARLVARGPSSDDVAATRCLSRHTVRDHLKAIYEKVGVRSRAELTFKIFIDPS